MTKKVEQTQLLDGEWYALHPRQPPYYEECCSCGLIHKQEWKIDNGRIMYRYTVDKKRTMLARKNRGITKEVQAVIRKEKGSE